MHLGIEKKVNDLEEKLTEMKVSIQRLADLQMKHENLDEIRAVKQDTLNANIQSLCGNLKDYQKELHEISLKNTEEIGEIQLKQTKMSVKLTLLWGLIAVIGSAVITVLVEHAGQIMQVLQKGN
jgi:predicted  nucleic acid-binding Zn-ribbon protein